MRREVSAVILLMGAVILPAAKMFAHHAGTLYDREHPITLTGTVTEYAYINPHVHVLFDVKEENGAVTRWTAEAGPPHGMYRSGWTRESLKPGDTITVTGFPYKDGKKIMDILKLAGPGGAVLNIGKEKDKE